MGQILKPSWDYSALQILPKTLSSDVSFTGRCRSLVLCSNLCGRNEGSIDRSNWNHASPLPGDFCRQSLLESLPTGLFKSDCLQISWHWNRRWGHFYQNGYLYWYKNITWAFRYFYIYRGSHFEKVPSLFIPASETRAKNTFEAMRSFVRVVLAVQRAIAQLVAMDTMGGTWTQELIGTARCYSPAVTCECDRIVG